MNRIENELETLSAMRRMEDSGYQTVDWFASSSLPLFWDDESVDVECRTKMTEWCRQVVRFCKFSHETVEVTMNIIDRFMATPQGTSARHDRSIYQLVCMAALYTAFKVHEERAMTPELVARLSNGTHSAQDIKTMEVTILTALKWKVNPPSSFEFARRLMSLVSKEVLENKVRSTALDLARIQLDLAISNYIFLSVPASKVAYAAIMNSLECVGVESDLLNDLGYLLSHAVQVDQSAGDILAVQSSLYQSVTDEDVSGLRIKSPSTPCGVEQAKDPAASHTLSPRSVVQ